MTVVNQCLNPSALSFVAAGILSGAGITEPNTSLEEVAEHWASMETPTKLLRFCYEASIGSSTFTIFLQLFQRLRPLSERKLRDYGETAALSGLLPPELPEFFTKFCRVKGTYGKRHLFKNFLCDLSSVIREGIDYLLGLSSDQRDYCEQVGHQIAGTVEARTEYILTSDRTKEDSNQFCCQLRIHAMNLLLIGCETELPRARGILIETLSALSPDEENFHKYALTCLRLGLLFAVVKEPEISEWVMTIFSRNLWRAEGSKRYGYRRLLAAYRSEARQITEELKTEKSSLATFLDKESAPPYFSGLIPLRLSA